MSYYGLGVNDTKAQTNAATWHYHLTKTIYQSESNILSRYLPDIFGYYLLQLGGSTDLSWLKPCPIRYHYRLIHADDIKSEKNLSNKDGTIVCKFNDLPLASDSIDAVLLPHILEKSPNPASIIAELQRVLIAEGTLIVLGLNPFSPWGLQNYFKKNLFEQLYFHRIGKVRQWLQQAEFDIEHIKTFYYRPILANEEALKRLKLLETLGQCCFPRSGSIYFIFARKKVYNMSPIKVKQQKVSLLTNKKLAAPTTGSFHEKG